MLDIALSRMPLDVTVAPAINVPRKRWSLDSTPLTAQGWRTIPQTTRTAI